MHDEEAMPFWHHLDTLRATIVKTLLLIFTGMFLCFFFYEKLFEFLILPLKSAGLNKENLVLISPLEGMYVAFKVAFCFGAVLTSPLWLILWYRFISPALKVDEKRMIFPFLFLSLIFATLGFIFSYYITLPFANAYLHQFNQTLGTNLWTLSSYVNYTILLILANMFCFELMVILLFLIQKRVLKASTMVSKRRHAMVGSFILAALVTPPDIPTQIMLAIPLIILYEFAIFYARLLSVNTH